MLTAYHLSKTFDLQPLFENVSFSLNPSERVGLVGPNGCGKTTLLRILAGEETPDSGHVGRSPSLRIGYLTQSFRLGQATTLGDQLGRVSGDPSALEDQLVAVSASLATHPADPVLQETYDDYLRRLEFAQAGRALEILAGLGLAGLPAVTPILHLSGGQQTRLSLAMLLLEDPQLLLLDEPTNHLDIEMLEWLENWLVQSPCGVLLVSHDRTFLDHTVTCILEMDSLKRSLREYSGNYSAYYAQKQAEIDKQWGAYHDQAAEIKRMQADIARTKAQAADTERKASSIRIGGPDYKIKGYKSYQQGIAKKVAKKASARAKKLERFLESDERVERPQNTWVMKLDFNETSALGKSVIQMDDLSVGYNQSTPLLSGLRLEVRAGRRIVLTGPNGSGKTTLLRTIAGQIPPLAGEMQIGPTVRLGYMTQDQSGLDPTKSVVDTVADSFQNQTQARSFLAYFLFVGDEALKPVYQLSYGQRARLMLASLALDGCNCLLLDEPVNHLDIPSRAQFEQALSQFEGAILAVVHDRYFIERFAQEVWWTEAGTIRRW